MKITSVSVRKITKENSRLRGIASVLIDDAFAIHDIRIIEGDNGLFIAMPSRKTATGEYRDVELSDYGINESMCSKIILYASARLFAKVDPQIAAKEENIAEQYFDSLPVHGTSFTQKVIKATYRIGE